MAGDNWYRVDNVAKVFLATYTERDTRSLRVSCTLNEDVEPEILEEALHQMLRSRPQLQVRIRRGVFWHYVEDTDHLPTVEKEQSRPCPMLYGREYNGVLHFQTSYFGKRINLDIFHGLTDGTGALEYLNILVANYLKIKHPELAKDLSAGSGAGASDLEQDSFSQFSSKPVANGVESLYPDSTGKSYHIRGIKLPLNQLQFFEIRTETKGLLKLAKEAGASLTCYLAAVFMTEIYRDMPMNLRKKPICVSVPVNLRNYFPSATNRNFFNSVHVSHTFTGEENLADLAKELDAQLRKEITPEAIQEKMNRFRKLENVFFIRMVPLLIKQPVVRFFSKRENEQVTMVLSNLGKMEPPEPMRKYIRGYTSFCSTSELFVTAQSYGDEFVLGAANAFQSPGVLRNVVRFLASQGLPISVSATEVAK